MTAKILPAILVCVSVHLALSGTVDISVPSSVNPLLAGYAYTITDESEGNAVAKVKPLTNTWRNHIDSDVKCETDASMHAFPHPSNCSHFQVACQASAVNVLESSPSPATPPPLVEQLLSNGTCPTGQIFDAINLDCMTSTRALCGVFVCASLDAFYPDPKDKNSFIQCVNGAAKRKHCEPKGTVFDMESNVCIWIPEEIPFGLKLFQAFIWIVQSSESGNHPTHGFITTHEDYVKAVVTAAVVVIMYLLTVLFFYLEVNYFGKKPDSECFFMDEIGFHERYLAMPHGGSRLETLELPVRTPEDSTINNETVTTTPVNDINFGSTRF